MKIDINKLLDLDELDEKRYEIIRPHLFFNKVETSYTLDMTMSFQHMIKNTVVPNKSKAPRIKKIYYSVRESDAPIAERIKKVVIIAIFFHKHTFAHKEKALDRYLRSLNIWSMIEENVSISTKESYEEEIKHMILLKNMSLTSLIYLLDSIWKGMASE